MPSTAPPRANRQNHSLFLCRSGQARMERPAEGQTVREGRGRKRKAQLGRASAPGVVKTSPDTSTAGSGVPEELLLPSLRSFHVRNLPITLHQNRRAGGVLRDQPSSSFLLNQQHLGHFQSLLSPEKQSLRFPLRSRESLFISALSSSCCGVAPSPGPYLGDCSPPSQASHSTAGPFSSSSHPAALSPPK